MVCLIPSLGLKNNRLIFMHDYASPPELGKSKFKDYFCPLNGAESIKDMCNKCRRCFDGTFLTRLNVSPLMLDTSS